MDSFFTYDIQPADRSVFNFPEDSQDSSWENFRGIPLEGLSHLPENIDFDVGTAVKTDLTAIKRDADFIYPHQSTAALEEHRFPCDDIWSTSTQQEQASCLLGTDVIPDSMNISFPAPSVSQIDSHRPSDLSLLLSNSTENNATRSHDAPRTKTGLRKQNRACDPCRASKKGCDLRRSAKVRNGVAMNPSSQCQARDLDCTVTWLARRAAVQGNRNDTIASSTADRVPCRQRSLVIESPARSPKLATPGLLGPPVSALEDNLSRNAIATKACWQKFNTYVDISDTLLSHCLVPGSMPLQYKFGVAAYDRLSQRGHLSAYVEATEQQVSRLWKGPANKDRRVLPLMPGPCIFRAVSLLDLFFNAVVAGSARDTSITETFQLILELIGAMEWLASICNSVAIGVTSGRDCPFSPTGEEKGTEEAEKKEEIFNLTMSSLHKDDRKAASTTQICDDRPILQAVMSQEDLERPILKHVKQEGDISFIELWRNNSNTNENETVIYAGRLCAALSALSWRSLASFTLAVKALYSAQSPKPELYENVRRHYAAMNFLVERWTSTFGTVNESMAPYIQSLNRETWCVFAFCIMDTDAAILLFYEAAQKLENHFVGDEYNSLCNKQ